RGVRGGQRADPAGRGGGAPGEREGARLRARVGGRAALPVQRGAPEQRDAGARRVAALAGERRVGPVDGRAGGPGGDRRGRRGRGPGGRHRQHRRQVRGGPRLRGRSFGRGRGRVHVVRPADPRRGRFHLDQRGGGRVHGPRGVVADDFRPRVLRRPEGAGRRGAAGGDGVGAHRGGGHHRHAPDRTGGAPGGGPLGGRDLPPSADDRAERAAGGVLSCSAALG